MAHQYHPEFYQEIEPLLPMFVSRTKPAIHDIQSRRSGVNAAVSALLGSLPAFENVKTTLHHAVASDGYEIPVHEFRKEGVTSPTPTAGILHIHGGGMILGSVDVFKRSTAQIVDRTGIPLFSVDYRLAPEVSGTALVEDCHAALVWLSKNAQRFNIDPARIIVFGQSSGGGLAAGVALKARDEGFSPPLAKQVLIFPMLDDRNNQPIKAIEALRPMWGVEDNITGWTALLGKDKAGIPEADVSEYAAPARAKSVKGLPPTYIEVGTLDIFRDEDMLYASRIAAENIPVEFHLYPGLPHGFELLAPGAGITRRALENKVQALLAI